jgi:nucleotide-binding universal stress UspA family protein
MDPMFKRILVATDGSALSRKAISTGVELARLTRATIVGVHARPPTGVVLRYGEASIMLPPESEAAYRERVKVASGKYLAEVEAAARKSDVRFEGVDVEDPSPADAILRTAQQQNCDLIVMASHGRRGLSLVLMGSETIKVLTHATQPVVVTR